MPAKMVERVRSTGVSLPIIENGSFVVVSQDCDLVHDDYDDEPVVEVLLAKRIADSEKRSELLAGKNPRHLQLRMSDENGKFFAEARPFDRWMVPRHHFEQYGPDAVVSLDRDSLERIPDWLAKRYNRPALPDAFNDRTSTARSKFLKLLQKKHKYVTGIFVELSTYEELSDEPYVIGIHVVAQRALWQDEAALEEVGLMTTRLEALFCECKGISVEFCALQSEAQFSLEDIRKSDEWDVEYMSHREKFRK